MPREVSLHRPPSCAEPYDKEKAPPGGGTGGASKSSKGWGNHPLRVRGGNCSLAGQNTWRVEEFHRTAKNSSAPDSRPGACAVCKYWPRRIRHRSTVAGDGQDRREGGRVHLEELAGHHRLSRSRICVCPPRASGVKPIDSQKGKLAGTALTVIKPARDHPRKQCRSQPKADTTLTECWPDVEAPHAYRPVQRVRS
jgi:hypothetical protein